MSDIKTKTENISNFFIKYMVFIVIAVSLIALFFPVSSLWIQTSWINYLLAAVMFGMGLTLKSDDFLPILTRPKDIFFGIIAQYTIMPMVAFVLVSIFHFDPALSAGIILVGTCPGGTASNLITYLAKGDVAFSICLTGVNTLIAPFFTPFITYFLLQTSLKFDIFGMFLNLVSVVLLPVLAGFIVHKFFEKFAEKTVKFMPVFSLIAICLIIASVISHNAVNIFECGFLVLFAVILHNISGYFFGFMIAKALKMPPAKIKAFSIEIGMQNSGLATALAASSFSTLAAATVPGAVFSVWHNISGALLAGFLGTETKKGG